MADPIPSADPGMAPAALPPPPPVPTGFTTGPIMEGQDQGNAAAPSTAWDEFQPAPMLVDSMQAQAEWRYTHGEFAPRGAGGMTPAEFQAATQPIPAPSLTANDANELYGIEGRLKFDKDTPLPVAKMQYDAMLDRIKREEIAAREPGGLWEAIKRFGVGLLGQSLDPANIAISFIPPLGEARYAEWLASAGLEGAAGRTLARAAAGATAGAVGTAAEIPLQYSMATRQGADYGMREALLDIAYGAASFGTFHAAGGLVSDMLGHAAPEAARTAPAPEMSPAQAAVATVDTTTHETALRTALAQMEDGRPVEVSPMFRDQEVAAKAPDTAPRQAPERPAIPAQVIKQDVAALPSGQEVKVNYALVEASDLTASQLPSFEQNPNYPAELQPRDRTRSASAVQVRDIAQNMNPRLLGESPTASEGAPIIGPDGVVESGNGRVLAINAAYHEGLPTAAAYKEFLASKGYPVEGMDQPVLVRIRDQAMNPDERAAFARQANQRTTLEMAPSEQAAADARAIPDSVLELHRGGDIGAASNREFVTAFNRDAVGANERAAMMTADGSLSVKGRQRIEAALLARAYDDPGILAALLEDPESNIKSLGRAITDVAPRWALMRQEARTGAINPQVDITRDLLDAVNLVRLARDKGTKIADLVKQDDMFGGKISPEAEALLHYFFRGEDFTGPRSGDKIAEALDKFVEQARQTKGAPGLFGEQDVVGPQEILRRAGGQREGGGQASLFGQPSRGTGAGGRIEPAGDLGQRSLGEGRGGGIVGEGPAAGAGVTPPGSPNYPSSLAGALRAASGDALPEEKALNLVGDAAARDPMAKLPEPSRPASSTALPKPLADATAIAEVSVRQAQAEGLLTPDELKAIAYSDAGVKAAEQQGKLFQAAAACLGRVG